jgi:histone deacetylase 1/2
MSAANKRVAYVYHRKISSYPIPNLPVAEIKNYNYGPEHPMKPKRVAMTHDLITKYNMYHEMKVYVTFIFPTTNIGPYPLKKFYLRP